VPIYFDVWAAATPNGTALGELTQAHGKEYQGVHNGLGSGKFTINRHDAQAAWCATGNFVRVRLVGGGPFAYNSANYVGAFWLDEGADVPASKEEQGGETMTRGGRGALAYLEEAVLPEAALTYPAGPQADGTWLWTDEQLGSIWRRVIDEAQALNFLPDMTYDFTDTDDTASDPWLDFGGPFKLNIGLNLLAIADTLRAQGLTLNMTPALVCQAWQDYTRPDAGITFTVGDGGSIYDVAERKVHATPARSHVLVQGATENNTLTYRWVEDAAVLAELGRPKAGFLRYGNTPTDALLDRAGQKQITDLRTQREGPTTIGVVPRTGEIPFVDYHPGDTVTVDIPGVFDEVSEPIASISIVERPAGDYDAIIEFAGQTFDPTDPTAVDPPLTDPPDDSGPGGGVVDDRCCGSQPPYVCDPTVETRVPWSNDELFDTLTLTAGQTGNWGGTETVRVYDGATYRMTSSLTWTGSDNHQTHVGVSSPIGIANHHGSQQLPPPYTAGPLTQDFGPVVAGPGFWDLTIDILRDAWTGGNTGSVTGTLTVEYLSGPDPRFVGGGSACDPPEQGQHTTEQITLGSGGSGQTNFPYEPGSIQIIGGTVTPTETDPDTGEFDTNLPAGTVVNVHYQIADTTGTGASNPMPAAGSTIIPPALLSADTPTDGQVLTWQTGGTTTWETPSGGAGSLPWFDVTDPAYGAVGDGTTDDTLAFIAAESACAAAGGGIVYVPASDDSYIVSFSASGARHCFSLSTGVNLMGDGMHQSVIEVKNEALPAGTVFIPIEIGTATTGANSLFIRDLALVGNFSVINPVGKYIEGIAARHDTTPASHSDDITIERVRVVDVNTAIYCCKDGTAGSARTGNRHQRWLISDCQVDTADNKSFELQEAEDSAIVNCTTVNAVDGAQVHNYTVRSRIAGNRIEYKDSGVNVTEACSDIEVSGNILNAIAGGGVGFNGGIVIRREAFASTGPTSSRVQIVDNIVNDAVTADQIGLRFASYTMNTGVGVFADYLIARNIFNVTGTTYLYDDQFPAKTSATGLRVFDNLFTGAVATSASWTSTGTRVERNRFVANHTANGGTWHYRANRFDGTFTVSGSNITLDDGLIGNVQVSGTPSSGQVIKATGATTATWQTGAAVTAAEIAAFGFVGPIVMVPGITGPPEPVETADGSDYVYEPVG
jgi:hypothetical protein